MKKQIIGFALGIFSSLNAMEHMGPDTAALESSLQGRIQQPGFADLQKDMQKPWFNNFKSAYTLITQALNSPYKLTNPQITTLNDLKTALINATPVNLREELAKHASKRGFRRELEQQRFVYMITRAHSTLTAGILQRLSEHAFIEPLNLLEEAIETNRQAFETPNASHARAETTPLHEALTHKRQAQKQEEKKAAKRTCRDTKQQTLDAYFGIKK